MGNEVQVLVFTSVSFVSFVLSAPMAEQYSRSVDWLSRYGYLPPADPHTGRLQTKEGIENALRSMQKFAGIKQTGKLDDDTLRLMTTPRCSLPDIIRAEDMLRRRRRKRYALSGSHWDKTVITWSVKNFPSHASTIKRGVLTPILTYALKVWSDVSPLQFHLVTGSDGDIQVSFASSFHQDGYPFDGKGGTLAHAFFPINTQIGGDTHFDDEETWSYGDERDGTDLFSVAVHEFGHALGLSHSSSHPSIMQPYYQGAVGDIQSYTLPLDDVMAIQALYGKRKDSVTPRPGTVPNPDLPQLPSPPPSKPTQQPDPSIPDRCEGGYDAVANIRGEIFFFKGLHFWRIQRSGSLTSLVPPLIKNFWQGLPSGTNKIDAVYERTRDSHIIFFIGNQYWVFKDTVSLPGYPRPLTEWGMRRQDGTEVRSVDAAFVWGHNGKTYLFSQGEFWRFDESKDTMLDQGYPQESRLWNGVPSDPDDIISWGDGDAYFFKGNSYWIFGQKGTDHATIPPKSTATDWMRCEKPKQRDTGCNCAMNMAPLLGINYWLMWSAALLIYY